MRVSALADVPRPALLSVALFCAALLTACGAAASDDGGFEVVSEVLSDETTQDILVFAPEAEGSWPVVMVLHGSGGSAEDMVETSTELAARGLVVFAPTYRTDLSTEQGASDAAADITCAYRLAVGNADEYGGDLAKPITFVGWSLGAFFVLEGGLTNQAPLMSCGAEVPPPDVVVAISGCHYEFEGAQFTFDPSSWGNKDASVVLIAGDEDTTCAAWQSEDAGAALQSAGSDVDLEILEGADHFAPVFRRFIDSEFVLDDPAGVRTIELIVDAIHAQADR